METQSPSSSNATTKTDESKSLKQAACLNCRKSKTRCLRDLGDEKCKKCSQNELECITPDYRVGRKKGIKNKREGLEKAVHRIEQAIKRANTRGSQLDADQNTVHLQRLVNEAQRLLPQASTSNSDFSIPGHSPLSQTQNQAQQSQLRQPSPKPFVRAGSPSDNFAFDDAENPLQLLARASNLSMPQNRVVQEPRAASHSTVQNPIRRNERLQTFFGPFRPTLDVGPELDPIELGLVTEEESVSLFSYFYENLAHTRWGLDPLLHTPNFVRKQSSFLFTSIMAASSLFIPTAASMFKRLSSHSRFLSREIITHRNRSPEIVLGFMINVPWMAPGNHWSDDDTCSFMSAALTIATDIFLNKLITPSPTESIAALHSGRAPSECITARKALNIDGFQDVDTNSDLGRRLLRRRERIWLALFVLDRGVCLARGRNFTLPITPLIDNCANWHKSAIAEIWDGSLVSSTVLRKDLVNLIADVKRACDSSDSQFGTGSSIAEELEQMIDNFFRNWYASWMFAIGGVQDNAIPPYVEILVTHGRLSIYSSVINHPTAPVEAKKFFRAAGLSSALNVMRAAVQGESRLKSMPNNTAIMISFAACFAFYLSTMGTSNKMSLAPSIRRLIEETADVLERIGSSTPHRNGTSALYGQHLREVVGSVPSEERSKQPTNPTQAIFTTQPNVLVQQPIMSYPNQPDILAQMPMDELIQFSAMSDNQINEAINNAGDELETYLPNFQLNETTGLDWLNWFNMDVSN